MDHHITERSPGHVAVYDLKPILSRIDEDSSVIALTFDMLQNRPFSKTLFAEFPRYFLLSFSILLKVNIILI